MNFEALQSEAQSAWQAFNALKIPRILIGAVTCGRAAGAGAVKAAFEKGLAEKNIEAEIVEVGCYGMCYLEPLIEIGLPDGRRVMYGPVTEKAVPQLIDSVIVNGQMAHDLAIGSFGDTPVEGVAAITDFPMLAKQTRIVLRNAGIIDPSNILHYLARGGYTGLKQAVSHSQQAVIDIVKASGLRGRGGAGFPTGMKWEFAYKASGDQKYVICNADEGDPGAFMDRSVLESDPHAVLEGLAIAGYAIGASVGYLYVRAEYPLAIERLTHAIEEMTAHGLLGNNIFGSGFDFTLKIKKGAGAFVCGEETALMASIEGERGMPRARPPFPAQSGLHGKPTNINNVETLANVSAILQHGGEWYAQYGSEKSKGTKTFALAGKVCRTGLIEVPMGMTLREILYDIGGGIPKDKAFKAVQTGGPSGGCLPASLLDLKVDYESLASVGSIMGSGGMIVLDEDNCMVDVAKYFLTFTRNESCGKCTPCRVGSQHLLHILTRICDGEGTDADLETLEKLSGVIKAGSLCGLGQTMPNPVLSTLKYFKDEYVSHIHEHHCTAGVCKKLYHFVIDANKCVGCGACLKNCPYNAITGERKQPHTINDVTCVNCGTCFDVCPFNAISKV